MSQADIEYIRDALKDIGHKIDTLHKVIYVGNGRPSLMERTRVIEENQMNCPARNNQKTWPARLTAICAVAAIVISLVNIFVNL